MQKINLSSFEAVIFDMDGVLVNSEPFYVEVEQSNFRKLGLNISEQEHQTYQGTATDRMWKLIKERHGIGHPVDELVEMTNNLVTPYFNSLEEIEPMPGVELLLKKLKAEGIPLALASSSYRDVIEIILRKTGLKKYFEVVVDSRLAGSSKPEPDIFLLAAKELGVLPERCAVIEDSTNGIKAAKTAGMYCIAFAGPGSELQDQTRADLIISDFSELGF
ncbi:haloacid dehalogenase superfamily, subfamily IA, variant 3 with third motif having DD or ED/haloacid dehalogenase superfamily, subfamily IA, variant 1 with third motif having Dx(3-4)D or Dx(3-4)E [Mariniphaga anaerophila]|uniref:Haloacid dehalogenase superfamily, subfamily IA, variant 3 with third motif having DD or ED/haloacid dehalogenase superfamily, subfamily IA, variant 1 with third motif having Dx(3-4)D or Dx(3-4)E n=1 Tax=Mariniphaga anaerophila TaxID=1484053 RepID=A0A1M5DCH0_9BACT|nr:HAD family phosphatase [Mariniphaga anaerophila]SHF64709.1 haloacid dehalogenase superfamily, subfamily IA, variant 3 with third motif having DD or ED/haloacid dehalogenase superfamily, subfamily IA, variant 1 with third motif having Dx(3-4)D or Dx(3-4)E [Mariniphaga anaerophila]